LKLVMGKVMLYIVDESPLGIQHFPQLVAECNHSIKVPILRSARALLEDPKGGAPEVVRTSKSNESRF